MEAFLAGCFEKIGEAQLADDLFPVAPEPFQFGIVDLDENPVRIERVVSAGRIVIEITQPASVGRERLIGFA